MIQSGRGFVPSDYEDYSKVALLDSNAAENLLPGENPVGKTVEIGSEPFVVVGVIKQKDNFLPKIDSIAEYDQYYQTIVGSVMIPNTCWLIAFQFDEPENAIIKADSTDNMEAAGSAVAKILNRHIETPESGTTFEYRADDAMERVRNLQNLSESTNQQLIWIASISLLVGGIGVMNIMLVSVTERTREIGLKKAIGARKKTILAPVSYRGVRAHQHRRNHRVISGIGLSQVMGKVTGSPTAVSVPAIVVSVVFSMAIGVVFGLLPSVKAANLNPIEALRSE